MNLVRRCREANPPNSSGHHATIGIEVLVLETPGASDEVYQLTGNSSAQLNDVTESFLEL
jgi:hypothetical protein